MPKSNGSIVFALKAWTIKFHEKKFYVAPTNAPDEKQRWGKPYASLQAACAAIARRHADEWRARDQRRSAFHRKEAAR